MGKTPARCGGRGQIQGKLNRILLIKKKKTEANTAIKQILKHKTHGKRTIRTVQTRKRYVIFFNVHTWRYRSFIENCSIFVLFLSSQFFFLIEYIICGNNGCHVTLCNYCDSKFSCFKTVQTGFVWLLRWSTLGLSLTIKVSQMKAS